MLKRCSFSSTPFFLRQYIVKQLFHFLLIIYWFNFPIFLSQWNVSMVTQRATLCCMHTIVCLLWTPSFGTVFVFPGPLPPTVHSCFVTRCNSRLFIRLSSKFWAPSVTATQLKFKQKMGTLQFQTLYLSTYHAIIIFFRIFMLHFKYIV